MQPTWFAVFTKPRQELIALENLQRQQFNCFLPMALNPYQRRTAGQLRIEPLFPRYLFLHAIADQQSLAPVRSTRGVNSLVRFGMEMAEIPEAVIDLIRRRCDPETGLVRLDPARVGPGDIVRVFDGPLAGAEGLFEACSGDRRARLLIEILGRKTSVEVDRMMLQKVS
jgi:transcriptional antiterminator RfaH